MVLFVSSKWKPLMSKKPTSNTAVKKHTATIHIETSLGLIQRKIYNALLMNAYDNLISAKEHEIKISTLCGLIGVDQRNQKHLKNVLLKLVTTPVVFDVLDQDEIEWEATTLMSSIRLKNGLCTYEYSRGLANRLYNPNTYARINLKIQRDIKSSFSLTLYENCFRYLKVGTTGTWTLEQFRRLMGVNEKKAYNQFKYLNNKVIVPAVKEINKLTDIYIEPVFERTGRKTSGVKFKIKENPQYSMIDIAGNDKINESTAYKRLLEEGQFAPKLARQFVEDYGEKYVLEKLDYVKAQDTQGKVRGSKGGYLSKAIQEDYKASRPKSQIVKKQSSEQELFNENFEKTEHLKTRVEKSHRQETVGLIKAHFDSLTKEEQADLKTEMKGRLEGHFYINDFDKHEWGSLINFSDIVSFWQEQETDLKFPTIEEVATGFEISDWRKFLDAFEAMKAKSK